MKNSIAQCEREKCKLRTAFTLAEVLITLGIIGIVAAMTLPMLVAKYQKIQTISRLQKAYSTLNQTLIRASVDYDDLKSWDINIPETNSEEFVIEMCEKYFVPYMGNVLTKKGSTLANLGYPAYVNINGKTNTNLSSPGTRVYYVIELADSTTYFFDREVNGELLVYADLNGRQAPNIWGRDAFMFILTKNGKFKSLHLEQTRDVQIASCKNGKACAGLIEADGWQIKSDYPCW